MFAAPVEEEKEVAFGSYDLLGSAKPTLGVAIGYSVYVLLAVLVIVVLFQLVLERWQTSTLNLPQQASAIPALAFDDAFRVQAVIGVVPLAPTLAGIASSLVLQWPYSEAAKAQRLVLFNLFDTWWTALMVAVFGFNLVTGLPWIRRYYRRGGAPQPPPSPPTGSVFRP